MAGKNTRSKIRILVVYSLLCFYKVYTTSYASTNILIDLRDMAEVYQNTGRKREELENYP